MYWIRTGLVLLLTMSLKYAAEAQTDYSTDTNRNYSDTYLKPREWNAKTRCREGDFDASPCIIREGSIKCKNIANVEELKKPFVNFLGQQQCVLRFSLMNCTFKILPKGVFGRFKFDLVLIAYNELETIEQGVFEDMKDRLTVLHVGYNRIKTLDFIAEARNLKEVMIITEPLVPTIPDYSFANLPKIEGILFNNCTSLHSIGSNVFVNTPGIKRFEKCPLKSIGSYAFAFSSGTVEIIDSSGAIVKIGDNALSKFRGNITIVS